MWASGAAQAAQVVRIILRWFGVYEVRAAAWRAKQVAKLAKPVVLNRLGALQYSSHPRKVLGRLVDQAQTATRQLAPSHDARPQIKKMSDSDDLEAHLTEKIEHGERRRHAMVTRDESN